MERDDIEEENGEAIADFNSHAHVERDLINDYILKDKLFQLTRSRGAWQEINQQCQLALLFQLTRSRGAWLMLLIDS